MEQKKKKSLSAIRVEALKVMCEWCSQRSECQFNGTEGSKPCVQYMAVSKAIKL